MIRLENKEEKDRQNKLPMQLEDIIENTITQPLYHMNPDDEFTYWFHELVLKKGYKARFETFLPGFSSIALYSPDEPILQYSIKDDLQFIHMTYVAPISPSDVIYEVHKPDRLKKIAKWGNTASMNRIFFDEESGKLFHPHIYPRIHRDVRCGATIPKFKVSNGGHRFAYAQSNDISTVIAIASETFSISKSWAITVLKEIEAMLKNSDSDCESPFAFLF